MRKIRRTLGRTRGWKTLGFALVNIILANQPLIEELIAEHPGNYASLVGLSFMILRKFTTTPMGQAEPVDYYDSPFEVVDEPASGQ